MTVTRKLKYYSKSLVKLSKNHQMSRYFSLSSCLPARSLYVYSLRFFERKDRVAWQGFNHESAVFGRCGVCVLTWTVLLLKNSIDEASLVGMHEK